MAGLTDLGNERGKWQHPILQRAPRFLSTFASERTPGGKLLARMSRVYPVTKFRGALADKFRKEVETDEIGTC